MDLKTKVPTMDEWPTSTSPAMSANGVKCKATPGDSLTISESGGGKDSRPWNTTKVAPYDKQK